MSRILVVWVLAASVVGLAVGGCQHTSAPEAKKAAPSEGQPPLPKVKIMVGDVPLEVEVAAKDPERRAGYMFRPEPKDSGMLFVWPKEDFREFHMMNVSFDLDIGFIDATGSLLQIERMQAYRIKPPVQGARAPYISRWPAKYALEVPAGWFEAHKITEGAVVKIPPEVQAREEPEAAPKAKE
jgi:uncharacterized membrane protein (UPF0127 family)